MGTREAVRSRNSFKESCCGAMEILGVEGVRGMRSGQGRVSFSNHPTASTEHEWPS